jgi:hypothetical protein
MLREDKEDKENLWDMIPFCFKNDADKLVKRQLTCWGILWVILVVLSLVAVTETSQIADRCADAWNVTNASRTAAENKTIHDDCQVVVVDTWHHQSNETLGGGPVLLSRAFTQLGWARGFAIGYSIISIFFVVQTPKDSKEERIHAVYIKVPIVLALLLFAAAFEVNMFNGHAHGVLIGMASAIGVLFTIPGPLFGLEIFRCCRICKRTDGVLFGGLTVNTVWWALWSIMVLACLLFVGFWIDSCDTWPTYYPKDRCPKLRSGWYWAEYVFFWTMYLIVGYAIGASEVEGPDPYIGDQIIEPSRWSRGRQSPVNDDGMRVYKPLAQVIAEKGGNPVKGQGLHQRNTLLKF